MNLVKPFSCLLVITAWLFVTACSSGSKGSGAEKVDLHKLKLAGQIYMYAPEIDTVNGKVVGYCDCCSGHILFLNAADFVWIDDCEANETISKGKYSINDSAVILRFDTEGVSKNYNWEREADSTAMPEYIIKSETLKPVIVNLLPLTVNNKAYFRFKDGEYYYASPEKDKTLNDRVEELKQDSVWNKLMK